MINITLSAGDHQGDMVPTLDSPKDINKVQAVVLNPGNSLYSPSGAFRLTLQQGQGLSIQSVDDSTLQWKSGRPIDPATINWITIWTGTGTNVGNLQQAAMQADGNFVVYTGASPQQAVFNSQTDQGNLTSGAFIRMQDDGNLVIYIGNQAIWSTGTYARGGGVLAQKAGA